MARRLGRTHLRLNLKYLNIFVSEWKLILFFTGGTLFGPLSFHSLKNINILINQLSIAGSLRDFFSLLAIAGDLRFLYDIYGAIL